MSRRNIQKFKVVAWSRDGLRGTYNRIIASGATKRQALKEYAAHMARFPVSAPANYSYVCLYDDLVIQALN